MDERYIRFNEITFEAYIKKAIDRSVLKASLKKNRTRKIRANFLHAVRCRPVYP